MKKKASDLTFDEFAAECKKHNVHKTCPFYDVCPSMKHIGSIDLNKEIELPEPNKCDKCEYEKNCSVHNDSDIDIDEDYAELKSITKCSRFTPKKTYRPFKDTEELIAEFKRRFNANVPEHAMPLIWVKNKNNYKSLVLDFTYKEVRVNGMWWNLGGLFNDCTFLDGSPCGIKEN